MIIDDDPGVARLCQRVLERAGFEAIAITRPKQGVAILQQARIDLLLVDIRMPEMDGFEVMTQARQRQPDLAIVIMTGFGTLETAIQALRMGANGLILKPFANSSELVQSVQQALKETAHKREVSRLQAMRPIIEITQSLFIEKQPEKVVDFILDAITDHLACSHAGYYQRKGTDLHLTLLGARGKPPPEEESSLDGGPVARSDAWGVPVHAKITNKDEQQTQEYLRVHQFNAVMCAPGNRNEKAKGVLVAARGSNEPEFSEADFEMFTILARQVAVALENAELYADLRDYVRQIESSQRALIQAEKMAAIGRTTASIAHEVNNPLQAVQNCLHLAGYAGLPEEKRQHYMTLAKDELDRLMSTVRQMLDFSRPGAIDRELTDINQLVDTVLALLEQQMVKENIEIHRNFANHLPHTFVVSNQIQQVIFNILLNAMEAIGKNGRVDIKTYLGQEGVVVSLKDNGPGIPEDMQETIFEPFMSSKDTGTGLGLSVSYSIVEAHGGKLEYIHDPENPGAQFRVTLPYLEAT